MNFFRNKSKPKFVNSIKVIEGLPDIERPDGSKVRPQKPDPDYNIWNRIVYAGRSYETLGTGDGSFRGTRFSEDGSSESLFDVSPTILVNTGTSGVKYCSVGAYRNDLFYIYSDADENNYLYVLDNRDGTILSTTELAGGEITYAEMRPNGEIWAALDTEIYVWESLDNLSSPTIYDISILNLQMGDKIGRNASGKFFGAIGSDCRIFNADGTVKSNIDAPDVQDGRSSFQCMIISDDDYIYSVSAGGSPLVSKWDLNGNVEEQLLLQGSGTGHVFIFAEDRLFLYYDTGTKGWIGEVNQTTLAFDQTLELGENLAVGFAASDAVYAGDNLLIATHNRTTSLTFVDIGAFVKERSNTGFGGTTLALNTRNNRAIRG
jgi:hypothetical protein